MPISNIPNSVAAGMRARLKGTPQRLLYEACEAWVAPEESNAARNPSLMLVLPTLPVTATTLPFMRARAARPNSCKAISVSGTRKMRLSSRADKLALDKSTWAAASTAQAPASKACLIKPCPSNCSPLMAINKSSRARVLLSIDTPLATQSILVFALLALAILELA